MVLLRPSGDYGAGGGHHFYESVKNEMESFRLRDGDFPAAAAAAAADPLNDDTSSIASKKRIDSMFKTTAAMSVSVGADRRKTTSAGRRAKSLQVDDDHRRYHGGGQEDYSEYGYGGDGGDTNKNTVQEKIEKMFAEISSSELRDTDASMESTAGCSKYHVEYIGRAGLSGKISSLEGLQRPVRDMYFGYRTSLQHEQRRHRHFSGLLEISAAGLGIRYRDESGSGGTVHRTDHPFPSIAVWAALKYVCRRHSGSSSGYGGGYECAFLPLIADPDGLDKAPLFRDVDAGDRARLDAAGDHSPVFAVVTRTAGKRLECHGFACETENDALLVAANLYGALVAAMSSAAAAAEAAVGPSDAPTERGPTVADALPSSQPPPPPPPPPPGRRMHIRQRNGFTSMSSTAGSSVGECDAIGDTCPQVTPALQPSPPPPPPRPPRRNKKSTSSVSSASSARGGSVVDSQVAKCSDIKTFRMTVGQPPSLRRGVCNSSQSATADVCQQRRNKLGGGGGGDILTKVAIPRSKSFLGLQPSSSKYPRRSAGCSGGIESAAAVTAAAAAAAGDGDRRRRRSNGIMGFSDMFNELRLQEGLNNMDDILNAIINAEGMSYNDLKPIYREFLMKLAMALTKDELYSRCKAIMTDQKRRRNKRRSAAAAGGRGGGRRLNEKLRNVLDLRAAKSRIGAAFRLPDFCKRKQTDVRKSTAGNRKPSRRPRRRCSCTPPPPPTSALREQRRVDRKNRRLAAPPSPVCSTSDDSGRLLAAALRQRQEKLHRQQQRQLLSGDGSGFKTDVSASEGAYLHRTSSGYFSCSGCSAVDDDECSCAVQSLVSCSCDSDSCADSDKCYCGRPRRPRNIFDELKSRGFAASESSVSRADSPGTAWKKNELLLLSQHQRHVDGPDADQYTGGPSSSAAAANGAEPSKSLEYLRMASIRRPVADNDPRYSSVAKPRADRLQVYGPSSSSSSSSLSATTVCSSSSVMGGAHRRQRPQCRSGSSGSDNFRAIDYALFANNNNNNNNNGGRKTRSGQPPNPSQQRYRGGHGPVQTVSVHNGWKSHSSEAVHLTGGGDGGGGYRVYHHEQRIAGIKTTAAVRRHSVHDGGTEDVLSSFFKSDIENSLGYYP